MLSPLTLMTAALAAFLAAGPMNAQAPKSKRKPRQAKASGATATKAPKVKTDPAAGFTLLRTADCVLGIKGELVRDVKVGALLSVSDKSESVTAAKGAKSKQSIERFAYEIPGTLIEESEPKGSTVRFRFIPAVDMVAAKAQGQLHFEDRVEGGSIPPVILDAAEVSGADTFLFQAQARGGQILPVSGMVYLRGRVQGETAPPGEVSMMVPTRPVISTPMPTLRMVAGKDLTPPLRFTGISLWAWPNSKAAFTVAATLDYNSPGPQGSVTGHVEVSFRVGATQ